MSSSNKIDLERDFAAGVYLSKAENSIPPPPYTLYSIRIFSILIHTGNGGRGEELNQREG
jgi:hypothetical protein